VLVIFVVGVVLVVVVAVVWGVPNGEGAIDNAGFVVVLGCDKGEYVPLLIIAELTP
jgi:hypothetical protein